MLRQIFHDAWQAHILPKSLDLNFLDGVVDPRLATSGGSGGTVCNASGNRVAASCPRIEFDPITKACRGLLTEDQRINLFLQSATFTNASWTKLNTTPTAASTTGVDGGTTATRIAHTAANGTFSQAVAITAGSALAITIYAKPNASNFIRIDVGGATVSCWFNLSTGATGTNTAGSGNYVFSAKSITLAENGLYRCDLRVTTTTVTSVTIAFSATNADNTSSANGSSIYVDAAQAEVGTFSTSYIPTTAATVTRTVDLVNMTGANFSSWYQQNEGTFCVEADVAVAGTGGNQMLARASDNSFANNIVMNITGGGFGSIATAAASVLDGLASAPSVVTAGTVFKCAGGYASNDLRFIQDSKFIGTDNTVTIATNLTRLDIGSDHGGTNHVGSGHIRRVSYYRKLFPEALMRNLVT